MNSVSETPTRDHEHLRFADGPPLLPVRMLNEYVYCPRLAYLMWVQGEFVHSADTVEGKVGHQRVDRPGAPLREPKPAAASTEAEADLKEEPPKAVHARSVWLTSERLAITGKVDLVEAQGNVATPVDYKRGKRPHTTSGAWNPERVQLCAQGLLLREHGYATEGGFLYFIGSRERVPVPFTDELVELTCDSIVAARSMAAEGMIPPPLEEDYKCSRCALIGICLPDEVRFLTHAHTAPRPVYPSLDRCLPLYVQSNRARIRKEGDVLIVEEERAEVARARLGEVSHIVLHGPAALTTPALHECFRREIPVSYHSYGGWFLGHTVGVGNRNVEMRIHQFRAAADPDLCLKLARRLVAAKIRNGRVLIQRNWKGDPEAIRPAMVGMRQDARVALRAESLAQLLGIEGTAAARYFGCFAGMLSHPQDFDFEGRNRRPPRDPVNALLSLGYAMLVREWVVTLSAVGLDPYRGFYHQPRFGRPALALDMMEPFRPLIADSAAILALNNGEVQGNDFLHGAGGCTLTDSGRKKYIAAFERRMAQEVTHPLFGYRISYRRLLEVQARLLIRWLAGEIPAYPLFLTR